MIKSLEIFLRKKSISVNSVKAVFRTCISLHFLVPIQFLYNCNDNDNDEADEDDDDLNDNDNDTDSE